MYSIIPSIKWHNVVLGKNYESIRVCVQLFKMYDRGELACSIRVLQDLVLLNHW